MCASTTRLDKNGYGLCGTCREKFFISDLDCCAYCDEWVCPEHKNRIKGHTLCPSCYNKIKNGQQ